jgi:hypothetical protein
LCSVHRSLVVESCRSQASTLSSSVELADLLSRACCSSIFYRTNIDLTVERVEISSTISSCSSSYIVVTIYCLGLVYSLPRFFEYKTIVQREEYIVSPDIDNHTEYIDYLVITNRLQDSTAYQYSVHLSRLTRCCYIWLLICMILFLVLYSLFQSILPLLMLSYFNVELIRSVNASSDFLQHCTSTYGQATHLRGETNTIRCRDSIITRSVICLIGLFILCQVPASILNYIYMYHRNHPLLYICYDISNFLILLNSAVCRHTLDSSHIDNCHDIVLRIYRVSCYCSR